MDHPIYDPSPLELSRAWRLAADTAPIADALRGVYAAVASEITRRGPACWASGRCCNFERAGHRLYVTGLEAAYALVQLADNDDRASASLATAHHPVLTLPQVANARAQGGCPFQVANLCGIHAIKPLGCRVYFCDRTAQDWQHELTESGLRQIRAIHDQFNVPYRYGEWREMLEMLMGWDLGSGE